MKEAEMLRIARRWLCRDLETLEERGADRLDFCEVSVSGIQNALRAAYDAGVKAGKETRS